MLARRCPHAAPPKTRVAALGTIALDVSGNAVGANLTRVSLGSNYTINSNTQWKTELRLDQSSGYNFVDADGKNTKSQTTIATSIVLSF